MKPNQHFGLLYCLLVIAQAVLSNFCHLGPYVMLSILPAMVLCIPLNIGTIRCMFIAFASGLCVDLLSEGLAGLNAAAILPVALLRKPIIKFFLGEDLLARNDSFSFRKNGALKISAAVMTTLIIYTGIYVLLDGAGTRPAWFIITKFFVSLICCFILSLIVTAKLTPDDRKEGAR